MLVFLNDGIIKNFPTSQGYTRYHFVLDYSYP